MLVGQNPDKILPRKILKDKVDIFLIHKCFLKSDHEINWCLVVPNLGQSKLRLLSILIFLLFLVLLYKLLALEFDLVDLFLCGCSPPEVVQNTLLILDMLYALGLVNRLLGDDFQGV